jgi:polysaccharide biosynthesis protein PslF
MSAAIRTVLTDADRAAAMAAEARRLAPELSWAAVARRYDALGARLLTERLVEGPILA